MKFATYAGIAALTVIATSGIAISALAQSQQKGNSNSNSRQAPPAAQPVPAPAAAAAPATGAAAKTADFQTMDQLQKAGVKRCLQLAQAVGQATMVGTTEYAAASTWHSKQPDNRFSVSVIGQKFGKDATASSGISGVFSAPTSEGKCDAAAIQIIPTSDPCSKAEAQIKEKGRSLGNLAGVPLMQNAANAQVMLMPAPNNGCVLVALSTVYMD